MLTFLTILFLPFVLSYVFGAEKYIARNCPQNLYELYCFSVVVSTIGLGVIIYGVLFWGWGS